MCVPEWTEVRRLNVARSLLMMRRDMDERACRAWVPGARSLPMVPLAYGAPAQWMLGQPLQGQHDELVAAAFHCPGGCGSIHRITAKPVGPASAWLKWPCVACARM
eukprot:8868573-Alexandrium_andersonii.AAC.1